MYLWAYYDPQSADLIVAQRAGGAWTRDTVDSVGDVGSSPSMTIDSDGVRHVVYSDDSNLNLKYARRGPTDSGWEIETVDSNGSVGQASSIVVDQNGRVHVAYYDQGNKDVKYATRCP